MTVSLQNTQISDPRASRPSIEPDVFVAEPQIFDTAVGGRNPGGEFARFGNALHQASDKGPILLGRQPIVLPGPPFLGGNGLALGIGGDASPGADRSLKAQARESQPKIVARFSDQPVPALDADFAIFGVG